MSQARQSLLSLTGDLESSPQWVSHLDTGADSSAGTALGGARTKVAAAPLFGFLPALVRPWVCADRALMGWWAWEVIITPTGLLFGLPHSCHCLSELHEGVWRTSITKPNADRLSYHHIHFWPYVHSHIFSIQKAPTRITGLTALVTTIILLKNLKSSPSLQTRLISPFMI